MRQTLFRGKTTPKEGRCEFNNSWVYGDLIRSGGKCYIHPSSNVVVTNGEIGQLIIMHEVVPETVSQWTGLVDKKRVKIFDGDVVKEEPGKQVTANRMYKVRWNTTHAAFLLLSRHKNGLSYFPIDEFKSQRIEVIGNKWDNPELVSVEGSSDE